MKFNDVVQTCAQCEPFRIGSALSGFEYLSCEELLPIVQYYWEYFLWVADCWTRAGYDGIKQGLLSFAEASQWWEEVWK